MVLTHPEAREPVKEASDELLSTGQMIRYVQDSEAKSFVIGTESGMIHPLKKVRPDAEFVAVSKRAVCPNMKKITVDKIISALQNMQYQVSVEQPVRSRARKSLERMIEVLPAK